MLEWARPISGSPFTGMAILVPSLKSSAMLLSQRVSQGLIHQGLSPLMFMPLIFPFAMVSSSLMSYLSKLESMPRCSHC